MIGQINNFRACRARRFRGVTLVEIFIALGVLAVALSVAATPLERISARIDVDIARDNIVRALEAARRSAARANVPVRVYLSEDLSDIHPQFRLVAGYSHLRGTLDFYPLPSQALPEHVTVRFSEGMSVIEFLPAGQLAKTGKITVYSESYPGYVVDIDIEDTLGEALILQAPGSLPARRGLH